MQTKIHSSQCNKKMSAQQQQPQDYSEAWRQYYAAQAAYAAQQQGRAGGAGQVRRRKREREKARETGEMIAAESSLCFFSL